MIDQLEIDNEGGKSGQVKKTVMHESTYSTEVSTVISQSQDGVVQKSKEYEYNPDFDVEKLQEEKEAEIKEYVQILDGMKGQIDEL